MKIRIKSNGETTITTTTKSDREFLNKWLESKGFKNIGRTTPYPQEKENLSETTDSSEKSLPLFHSDNQKRFEEDSENPFSRLLDAVRNGSIEDQLRCMESLERYERDIRQCLHGERIGQTRFVAIARHFLQDHGCDLENKVVNLYRDIQRRNSSSKV